MPMTYDCFVVPEYLVCFVLRRPDGGIDLKNRLMCLFDVYGFVILFFY